MTGRLIAALVAVMLVPVAAAAQTDAQATQRGAAWLQRLSPNTGGQQADIIVALAAAGRSPAALRTRMDRLVRAAPGYATTAGSAGKVVLAAVATRRDPRRLGGVNYVARITSQYAGGRYGASAYDQAYALLALRAAGERPPAAATAALRAARGAGGWGFALRPGQADDVSATGILIEAMRAAGVPRTDRALVGATAWLLAQANRRGGYHIGGRGRPTEANSTALAIRALRAMGRVPSAATRQELRRLQEPDGGFRFTASVRESRLIATVDAVVATAGRRLPPPY